jgi:hypothetical protein
VSARSQIAELRDPVVALLLAIVTVLSRIPFVTERLWEWDSVLYARALEQGFHVGDVLAQMRPHPPGYIFYVGTAALAKLLGLDSDHALVAVSVIASGAATAACYLLCRRFVGRPLSAALAIAFATAPLVWLHGEVAMPYILLAPLSTVLALAFRDARGAGVRRTVLVSFAFGALGGFRQDVLVFLLPLWLWMLWPATAGVRLRAAAGFLVGCIAWVAPTALLSDGLVAYVTRSVRQLIGVSAVSANVERSIPLNAVIIGDSLLWGGLVLLVALLVLGLSRALASILGQRLPDDGEAGFFALWLVPALLFYLFVHIGEWGYVLSLVPGIYVLLAWLLARSGPRERLVTLAVLANAAFGAALFLAGDHPVFSRASLVAHDQMTDAKTAWIREHAPRGSIVVAAAEILVVSYYLPDRVVRYSNVAATTTYDLAIDGPVTLIIYEPAARPPAVKITDTVEFIGGATLDLATVSSGTLRLGGTDIGDLRR